MGIVRGSAAQAELLIISKDTVYVHSNIKPVEDEEGLFEYHEIQYEKDEYIKLMGEQNKTLMETLDILISEMIPSLMMQKGGCSNE